MEIGRGRQVTLDVVSVLRTLRFFSAKKIFQDHVRNLLNMGEQEEDSLVEASNAEHSGKSRRRRKRKRKQKVDDDNDDDGKADSKRRGVESPTLNDNKDDEKRSQVDRTVYVEGIPFSASPDQVKQFFVDKGIDDIEDCRLPVWHDSGRLKGYGHIVFASASSYEAALKLSGDYLESRYLTIQPANVPRQVNTHQKPSHVGQPSKTIILGNLAYDANEDDIEEVVKKKYASLSGVRVVRHSQTQVSKGFAYVDFDSLEDSKQLVEDSSTQQLVVRGRACRVDYDHGRIKGSFRGSDGKVWRK